MKDQSKKNVKKLSRRGILPLLGSSLLIPFLGFGNSKPTSISGLESADTNEYQTLLRPDGTTVKVKKSVLKDAEVVQKNISNHSFLNWISNKK